MKKLLLFFIFFFIFINGVNAAYLTPTSVDLDSTISQVSHFVRYNGNWYKNTTSKESTKIGFQYDTSALDRSKRYVFNMIAFVDSKGGFNDSYIIPIANFSGSVCNVTTTVMNSRFYDNETNLDTYTEMVGTWFSIVCDNVTITEDISYLDFFLGNTDNAQGNTMVDTINTGRFFYTDSTTQNLQDAIISNNKTLNTINQTQQETNRELGELNDNLTNSDSPDNMGGLSNSAGWLPAGPIDSIINLPLSMLNNISDNLSKSCQPVNLPIPFINKNLPLPCLTSIYSQIDGLGPWITTISVIASAFILFSYLIKLYKWVDDTLTFRENNYIDNWGGL